MESITGSSIKSVVPIPLIHNAEEKPVAHHVRRASFLTRVKTNIATDIYFKNKTLHRN